MPKDTARRHADLRSWIAGEAAREGFDLVGIATASAIEQAGPRLREFIARGRHGTMEWLAATAHRRASPRSLWPEAESVIMLALNYGPTDDPIAVLGRKDRGAISVYAQNRDYHELIKGRLKGIAGRLAARTGGEVKVFVDTAPVMEKPLAEAAGLGWQGKHTNLVSRRFGSWLFLGSIFTTVPMPADPGEGDHCGTCRACIDICPTDAFPAPYQLDARRCISYLTIEHKGPIPHAFRKAMGNRIFGCDDCLAVCPWNKYARTARESALIAREELRAPELGMLLTLDDAGFRALFSRSPVKRIGRDRFIRNVLIAAGNSGLPQFSAQCRNLLRDASLLVRGAAVWALGQLEDVETFSRFEAEFAGSETEMEVREEWRLARKAKGSGK